LAHIFCGSFYFLLASVYKSLCYDHSHFYVFLPPLHYFLDFRLLCLPLCNSPLNFCRAIFGYFTSAMEWLQRNKYFHVVVKGVERDGWKFVLLARFSPLPSYIINYALSATDVGFFRDFLLPTIIGCLPMILQNVSIVSLAGAAVASTTGSQKSHIYSYLFPSIGIASSILISWRIKQYSSALAIPEELKSAPSNGNANGDDKHVSESSKNTNSGKTKKRR
jgi:hypothetical protein